MPGTSESVFERPCGRVGVEPTTPRSNRTLHHGQIDKCPRREQAITVRKCSTAELRAPRIGCEAGVEPATSRLQGEVTAIYTTAKPVPGTREKGLHALTACTVWREVALVCRHGPNWCLEKCSHLRLFLFREALELSQLSRQKMVRPARVELARRSTVVSRLRVCLFHHGRMMRSYEMVPSPGLAPGSG